MEHPCRAYSAQDARQGAVHLDTLEQTAQSAPVFKRRDTCLTCHLSRNSMDVPGMLVRSQFTSPTGAPLRQLGQFLVDHRTPLDQRWGGYYVTGTHGAMRHMGNGLVGSDGTPASTVTSLNVTSLEGRLDTTAYPSPFSDIVSLMVFDHQMHMMNLLTRVGWEARVAIHDNQLEMTRGPVHEAVGDLVDYLLFVDEGPSSADQRGPGRVGIRDEIQRARPARQGLVGRCISSTSDLPAGRHPRRHDLYTYVSISCPRQ